MNKKKIRILILTVDGSTTVIKLRLQKVEAIILMSVPGRVNKRFFQ